MYSFHQENEKKTVQPEEVAKLLRSIGASGRFVGFNYIVFIVCGGAFEVSQGADSREAARDRGLQS